MQAFSSNISNSQANFEIAIVSMSDIPIAVWAAYERQVVKRAAVAVAAAMTRCFMGILLFLSSNKPKSRKMISAGSFGRCDATRNTPGRVVRS